MKNITLLICLLLSFSLHAASTYTEADIIDAIKNIDQKLNGDKPLLYKNGAKATKKELKDDRKKLMEALIKMGGKEKKTEIEETCINKYNGWTQTWTKENNPKKTCQKKWIADEEECAIKSGKALTDKAAGLIFNKCNEKAQSTYKTCRNNLDEKYKHILPKAEKCVDQAYLEN